MCGCSFVVVYCLFGVFACPCLFGCVCWLLVCVGASVGSMVWLCCCVCVVVCVVCCCVLVCVFGVGVFVRLFRHA